jgi:glutamate 5-kinase
MTAQGAATRDLRACRRIVVKLGSQVVLDGEGSPAMSRLYGLLEGVAALWKEGRELILVTSGAVGLGGRQLGMKPRALAEKQACAAVGQGQLMAIYQEGFGRIGIRAGQVLLTEDDFADPLRHQNLRRTLETLLALRAVPILNENDAVSTLELERGEWGQPPIFGDNDRLSAMVAMDLGADLLVLLSDVEALCTRNPALYTDAEPIREIPAGEVPLAATEGLSSLGRGGMGSKVEAARLAAASGIAVLLANGKEHHILERLLAGESRGTHFHGAPRPAGPA